LRFESELDPKLPEILGSESEIRDAMTNLILNAVDAMPEGGLLRIRTAGAGAAAPLVSLEVCDTGVGMDEGTRRRCLKPFYTTKGERGTGLGLAMVYGMAQRHRAEIEIESEPGKGTMIRLMFPVPAAAAPAIAHRAASQSARRLRILVVDDDPLL